MKFKIGRCEANLLWNNPSVLLRNNLDTAKRRLICLENKFKKDKIVFEEYNNSIRKQINLGIVEVFPENSLVVNCYYMPHHPTIRNDKSSSKLRIVYASFKSSNALLLNDCLHAGRARLSQEWAQGLICTRTPVLSRPKNLNIFVELQYVI